MAECKTMLAPCSMGLHRYGVAKVASTTRGKLWALATPANASKSATAPDGLPIISVYKNRVFSSILLAKLSGFSSSTNLASIPKFLKVTPNMVSVPP